MGEICFEYFFNKIKQEFDIVLEITNTYGNGSLKKMVSPRRPIKQSIMGEERKGGGDQ